MAKRLPPHKVRRMAIGESKVDGQSDDDGLAHVKAPVYIDCDTYQAARLNMLLPKHLKLEQDISVFKAMDKRKQQMANKQKQEEKNNKK